MDTYQPLPGPSSADESELDASAASSSPSHSHEDMDEGVREFGCFPATQMHMLPADSAGGEPYHPLSATYSEYRQEGWLHFPRGHDWFSIFYDLIFVAVCFKLGVDLKSNVSLYGVAVTAGLVVPLFSTWLKTTLYRNRFYDDSITDQCIHSVFACSTVGLALFSDDRLAVFKEGSMLVEGEALHLSAAHAAAYLSSQLLLMVLLLNVPQEARTKARVLMLVYAVSSALWIVSIPLCMPMKIVLWLLASWIEQSGPRYLQQVQSSRTSHSCFAPWGGSVPVNIPNLSARIGELVMLVIGESVISIVIALQSRIHAKEQDELIQSLCCSMHSANLPHAQCPPVVGHCPAANNDTSSMDGSTGGWLPLNLEPSILGEMKGTDAVIIVLGTQISYMLHVMYFHAQPHHEVQHAMRRSARSGQIWLWTHLPLFTFLLIFGVSFKKFLFLNGDAEQPMLSLTYATFMAVPCALVFFCMELIKSSHSGFCGCIKRKTHGLGGIDSFIMNVEMLERSLIAKFTLARLTVTTCILLLPLDCIALTNAAGDQLLAGGGGGSGSSSSYQCSTWKPWNLTLAMYVGSVLNWLIFNWERRAVDIAEQNSSVEDQEGGDDDGVLVLKTADGKSLIMRNGTELEGSGIFESSLQSTPRGLPPQRSGIGSMIHSETDPPSVSDLLRTASGTGAVRGRRRSIFSALQTLDNR